MGTGIGYGRNDPETLADTWRRRLAEQKAATSGPDPALLEKAWADEINERIRKAIETTNKNQVEVGEFLGRHLAVSGGEFYPTRDQLRGGAVQVWDFCQQQGVHLFVGGDFKMSGTWRAPFEIIIRLER